MRAGRVTRPRSCNRVDPITVKTDVDGVHGFDSGPATTANITASDVMRYVVKSVALTTRQWSWTR
jgi:hypothetical protein